MNIRVLTSEDAQPYQALRLRSLHDHPEAFGNAFEDESSLSIDAVAERLHSSPDRCVIGTWDGDNLAGIVSFARYPGRKTRHRAMIGAMYVVPELRGQGIGSALLNAVIHHARALADLEELILAVTVGNETARALYLAGGFRPAYVEKGYIKLEDQYYDIEWMTLRL